MVMTNSSSFLFALCLLVSVINLLNPISCNGQSLFIFGDSLYDVGNKQYLTSETVPSTYWPYGLSIDNPTGRWSDGFIVPDFIAEFLGIPYIPPVLNTTADFSYGANYATADATVLGTPSESMSLNDQIKKFTQNKDKWTPKEISSALYLFYIGSEDYLNYIKTQSNPTPKQQQYLINQVIQEIEKSLVAIYRTGGRKFVFQNLGPLGCLPIVKQQNNSGDECVELPTNIAAQHNKDLSKSMEKLAKTLDGFTFSIFDYFNSTLRRINYPAHYRYISADVSCCGVGSHTAFGCGFKNVHSVLCNYQRGYLFWDGKHNAEKSNEAMAQLMWSANPRIVGPKNLRELAVFPIKQYLMKTANQKTTAHLDSE